MARRQAPGRTDEGNAAIAQQEGGAGAGSTDEQLPGAPGAEGSEEDAADAGAADDLDLVEKMLPRPIRDLLKISSDAHATLLAEACYVFGVNPDPTLKPLELLAHKFDPGALDGATVTAPAVTIVTAGGLKLRYPVDDDTEHRLRIVYHAYRVNPKTNEREVLPLPQDLTLPRESIDGIVRSGEHTYRTGYIREGGAAEAARRATLRTLRTEGKLR